MDYGYRAVHEMTVAAKAIIGAFYGNAPRLSYWNGCSTGGRQGLMEALRYPGRLRRHHRRRTGNYRTHQLTWELWVAQAVHARRGQLHSAGQVSGHPCAASTPATQATASRTA